MAAVLVAFRRKFRGHIALRPSELCSVVERWSISSHPHGSQLRLAHYVAPQPPQAPRTLTTKDLEKIRVVERTYPGRSLDFFDPYPSRSTEKLWPIRVPRRIPRSSTAILEALAETVGRDPTAPHYRYMDDPFFIPASGLNKRGLALSKESGRKAARYMVRKFPELVEKPYSNPPIPSLHASHLSPPLMPASPRETDLIDTMRSNNLNAAYEIWRQLKKDNISVPVETEEELLERLCFYNGNDEDVDQAELVEEQWFSHYIQKEARPRWKFNGLADQLFNGMQEKRPTAYAAMICGMAKYLNIDEAMKLFAQMEEQNMPIPVQVYNSVITMIPFLRDSIESRWEMTLSMLSKMDEQGIQPNLRTFNAVFEVISRIAAWRRSREIALQTLTEMRVCNVEPSLGTFHFLLQIFCRERGPVSYILNDILSVLEDQKLELRDSKDAAFFSTAMETAARHLQDGDIAKRLHGLFMKDGNSESITDAHKEQIYYNNLFRILVLSESVDEFLKYYDDLVPMVFTPDMALSVEIMKMLEVQDRLDLLPRIWSDVGVFGFALKEVVLEAALEIMLNNSKEELKAQFLSIAQSMRDRMDEQSVRSAVRLAWSGQLCGGIGLLLLRGGDLPAAWAVLSKYLDKRDEVFGVPDMVVFKEFIEALTVSVESGEKEDIVKIKQCLVVAGDLGYTEVTEGTADIAARIGITGTEVDAFRRSLGVSGSVSESLMGEV